MNTRSRIWVAESGSPRFYGWDEGTQATIKLHNLMVALLRGLGAKQATGYELPKFGGGSDGLFAPTLAEFDETEFLRIIAGG